MLKNISLFSKTYCRILYEHKIISFVQVMSLNKEYHLNRFENCDNSLHTSVLIFYQEYY